MLHMFSKNVEKNSSCCSQITEKHTHTHTHHVAADRSLLPESQNKSIFTSVVWLGRIHMRINSRAAIVVATDSTVKKGGGVRKGEDKRKFCGGARQPGWGGGGGGGMTLSRHKSKSKTDTVGLHDDSRHLCLSDMKWYNLRAPWLLQLLVLPKNALLPHQPEQQNIKLKVLSQIRHRDCHKKPPSTLKKSDFTLSCGSHAGRGWHSSATRSGFWF